MFNRLNNYDSNLKPTIKLNPSKLLNTKLTKISGFYKFNVYRKCTKLRSPWTSKTPKRYKQINGELYRSKRISSNSDKEIPLLKEKFMKADYSLRFINSIINEFQNGKDHGDESFIIPPDSFGISKPFISVEIPYCELNEIKPKYFLKKFHKFINDGFQAIKTWKTRNI